MTEKIIFEWNTEFYATDVICDIMNAFFTYDNLEITSEENVAYTKNGVLYFRFGRCKGHTTAIVRALERYQPEHDIMMVTLLPLWKHIITEAKLETDDHGYPKGIGRIPIDEIQEVDQDALLFMEHTKRKLQEEAIETYHNSFGAGHKPCPACKGEGRIPLFNFYEDPCQDCRGSGQQGEPAGPKFVVIQGGQLELGFSQDILTIEMSIIE